MKPRWPANAAGAENDNGPRVRAIAKFGAGEESRTPDLRITNALLYQLSYAGFTAYCVKPNIIADAGNRCQVAARAEPLAPAR